MRDETFCLRRNSHIKKELDSRKWNFKLEQVKYSPTWQRSPVTPGGHMHLKVLSSLSTHVLSLAQGYSEQGSTP